MTGKPLTREEAIEAVNRTRDAIKVDGMWAKVCKRCGNACGGRLGSLLAPTVEELAQLCCSTCRNGIDHRDGFRVEFVPPTKRGNG